MPDPVGRTKPSPGHERALAAREQKKKAALEIGIDTDFISTLVDRFYTKIRNDSALGPIFAARVADWPTHLDRMKSFWRSVLFSSGEYSGNPMQKHLAITGLRGEHFTRWLALFHETLSEIQRNPAATEQIQGRARMIANSLQSGIAASQGGKDAVRFPPAL